MKRFLIFLFLFPALATASFYAVIGILTGAVPDSLFGTGFLYLIAIGPALGVALVDWLITVRLSIHHGAIATTLVSYGISVLAVAWDLGLHKEVFALGLIGAIPSAVCSWLSQQPRGSANAV